MLNSFSIKVRLLTASNLPILLLAGILLLIVSIKLDILKKQSIESAREMLVESKKSELKHIVETVYTSIAPIYESDGEMETAVEKLKTIRFGKDGYIFGYNGDFVRVFNGSNESDIGKSYKDLQDSDGVYLIQELVKAGKLNKLGDGNHFVTYRFTRLGQNQPSPKLSYAIFLDKWDLMIGTGIYIDRIDEQVGISEKQIQGAKDSILMLLILVTVILIVIFFVVSGVINLSILKPLSEVTQSIKKLSEGNGDLTIRLQQRDNYEMGTLAKNVNALLDSLQDLVIKVRGVASYVRQDSHELVTQGQKITNLSEQQHMEIEQIATASTEMSETAGLVAKSAEDAAKAATSVDIEGQTALSSVQHSCAEMSGLKDQMDTTSHVVTQVGQDVENISAVLQVIESIAEQTNLLALNAAIEAARAGEQGRGFAVVADEVRNLASKTQGSTEEIQNMIHKLQSGSKEAVQVMDSCISRSNVAEQSIDGTSNSLSQIASSMTTVTNEVTQIATAAEQQSQVGGDISRRIVEISEQTTTLKEIAVSNGSIAQNLMSKTSELESLVSQFKA